MDKKQKILIAGAALFAALSIFSGIMLMWQYKDGKRRSYSLQGIRTPLMR